MKNCCATKSRTEPRNVTICSNFSRSSLKLLPKNLSRFEQFLLLDQVGSSQIEYYIATWYCEAPEGEQSDQGFFEESP